MRRDEGSSLKTLGGRKVKRPPDLHRKPTGDCLPIELPLTKNPLEGQPSVKVPLAWEEERGFLALERREAVREREVTRSWPFL